MGALIRAQGGVALLLHLLGARSARNPRRARRVLPRCVAMLLASRVPRSGIVRRGHALVLRHRGFFVEMPRLLNARLRNPLSTAGLLRCSSSARTLSCGHAPSVPLRAYARTCLI